MFKTCDELGSSAESPYEGAVLRNMMNRDRQIGAEGASFRTVIDRVRQMRGGFKKCDEPGSLKEGPRLRNVMNPNRQRKGLIQDMTAKAGVGFNKCDQP